MKVFFRYTLKIIKRFIELIIERSAENGGNLEVSNCEELDELFVSLKLHPADLKAFCCAQINEIFDSIRNGRSIVCFTKQLLVMVFLFRLPEKEKNELI
jgi:hypothetical protein